MVKIFLASSLTLSLLSVTIDELVKKIVLKRTMI